MSTCEGALRVWFPDVTKLPMHLPSTVEHEDETHLVYRCTRQAGHSGEHGWCQGFDTDWTYQWR